MLTLYYKPTCVYSQRVLGDVEDLGVTLDLKDITHDEVLQAELQEKGGKTQTPFLVDTDKDVSLYESKDIVDHIAKYYANDAGERTFGGLRVHKSDAHCDVCE